MYYVLFHYTEGLRAKDFHACRSDADVIEFLHENYKGICVVDIIEVKARHRLGLIVADDYIESTLKLEEETESLVPVDAERGRQILKEKKIKLTELETSAMEKIIDDAKEEREEAMTPEEKDEKVLDDADALIEREKKRQEQKKKGWPLCTVCNSNRTSPANKKGVCTPCQTKRKTNGPYSRSKEFSGL